jgi:hypothetical protein
MGQQHRLVSDGSSGNGVPVLLTVEEAGALLRIGRTKAYAMAREWRETDGRSGLPVIDLGHVLRVPRQALEEMVGAEFSEAVFHGGGNEGPIESKPSTDSQSRGQRNRPQTRSSDQLDLFEPTDD